MNKKNKDMERRVRQLRSGDRGQGPVVYWMSRDQRVRDNWALLWAQQEALIRRKGLLVVFCLVADYPGATASHYVFLEPGLATMQKTLGELNIPFFLLKGSPEKILPAFLEKIDGHLLVSDFDPLRIKKVWKKQLLKQLHLPFYEVDTHNIIPVWTVSGKKEYAAYTIRPKINRLLPDFLTDFPPLQSHPLSWQPAPDVAVFNKTATPAANMTIPPSWPIPGEQQAQAAAETFVRTGLPNYGQHRNNPCHHGQSGLSPYLHFGHLSPQRLALMVSKSSLSSECKEEFMEELVVRRELADNFCHYEPLYDTFAGFPEWAARTLDEHRKDRREYLYSLQELEEGRTHELLWNACQLDLVHSGKLHGYLRMYWAKKILEWTADPETALDYAITLNDRYSLDGRDANGYTGVAWSIGGVHDRAWKERPVFGKIRYMNEAGCRRKFDTKKYIESVLYRQGVQGL